jgi:hypothetical protein
MRGSATRTFSAEETPQIETPLERSLSWPVEGTLRVRLRDWHTRNLVSFLLVSGCFSTASNGSDTWPFLHVR